MADLVAVVAAEDHLAVDVFLGETEDLGEELLVGAEIFVRGTVRPGPVPPPPSQEPDQLAQLVVTDLAQFHQFVKESPYPRQCEPSGMHGAPSKHPGVL